MIIILWTKYQSMSNKNRISNSYNIFAIFLSNCWEIRKKSKISLIMQKIIKVSKKNGYYNIIMISSFYFGYNRKNYI